MPGSKGLDSDLRLIASHAISLSDDRSFVQAAFSKATVAVVKYTYQGSSSFLVIRLSPLTSGVVKEVIEVP